MRLYSAGDAVVFEREFRRQILTIFTRNVLESKKKLLFYVTDLVLEKVLKYSL